jgi:hypothetical protein
MWVPTYALWIDILAQIATIAGSETFSLDGCSIGLIAAPFTPTENLQLSGITEANFDGYTRLGMDSFSAPFIGPNGELLTESNALEWSPSDTITANTIYGGFLIGSADSTTLKATEPLDTPITLSGPLSRLTYVPRFGFANLASFGNSLVSN